MITKYSTKFMTFKLIMCSVYSIQVIRMMLKVFFRYTSTSTTFVSFQTVSHFGNSHLWYRSIIAEIFCHFDGFSVRIYPANTISFDTNCKHCKEYQRDQY